MRLSALTAPRLDPTRIFDYFRANFASEILTAAVAHFHIFQYFEGGPIFAEQLRNKLALAPRPFTVLLTALRAMGLIIADGPGRLDISELAREHLTKASPFDVSGYVGLLADSPGVLTLVERLGTNRPAGTNHNESGAAFIYREGIASAMESERAARRLTLALAGRARNVAPILAARTTIGDARVLLDVGGGTGIFSIAFLQKHHELRAIVWDRPEVLKVAAEFAQDYDVADRMECREGDMFTDAVPKADVILLSNVLHDWDVPQCQALISRFAQALPAGGQLLIHDAFLNDELDGPLPLALYSAALFTQTEGRAYSAAEYRGWLQRAGLRDGAIEPTLVHCAVLPAVKP